MSDRAALNPLGWSAAREAAFASFATAGLAPARVSLEHNHVYRVLTEGGERLAETAGRVKHRAASRRDLPVVGDWVAVRLGTPGSLTQIRDVLPRQSWFSRKVAGRETDEQVVAANIDTVLLTFGMDQHLKRGAIERYLVVAATSGATPVVVLNKIELVDDAPAVVEAAREAAPGAAVLAVSARTGAGIDQIEGLLRTGETVALLGPSGAGKSSIVNRLVGRDLLATGDVRARDLRGRHTSVHRQLVVRDEGGVIIDTPGMRELQLWEGEPVVETFPEIVDRAAGCRFRDCRHDREPGCAVRAAVDSGDLDPRRYDSYLKLQAEQAEFERRREQREQQDARRAGRAGPARSSAHERRRSDEDA
jgi:ribosome biogenesis GTPase